MRTVERQRNMGVMQVLYARPWPLSAAPSARIRKGSSSVRGRLRKPFRMKKTRKTEKQQTAQHAFSKSSLLPSPKGVDARSRRGRLWLHTAQGELIGEAASCLLSRIHGPCARDAALRWKLVPGRRRSGHSAQLDRRRRRERTGCSPYQHRGRPPRQCLRLAGTTQRLALPKRRCFPRGAVSCRY